MATMLTESYRHLGCCINAGVWFEKEAGAARLQESFYLISSQGAQIPTQRKKKKSHCCLQPGTVKLGREEEEKGVCTKQKERGCTPSAHSIS